MEYNEEAARPLIALDERANADKNRMTREEALAEGRKLRGPPYRMTIAFPLPPLTKEEEAAALAQAEYDDIMGNFEPDPEDYTIHQHEPGQQSHRRQTGESHRRDDWAWALTCTDGEFPLAGLIMDASGYLYGTTFQGGAHGHGTVFALTPNAAKTAWTETVLYSFCAQGGGAAPTVRTLRPA